MLKIGDFEIHLINDAVTHIDPGGAFGLVPRALWSRYMQPDDNHLIEMWQICLLVRAHGQLIVVDTGSGTKLDEKHRRAWHMTHTGGLVRGLAHLGVQPEDVDWVIDTHLHSDHAGGNTSYADDGTLVATFPNAQYVVQRREYDDAMQPNERTRATYFPENYHPLVESGQMRLLDGDTEFLPGITGIVTPGHTPGHMSVRFASNDQHAAFVCDMATFAVHFERLGWMTAYDVEPLVTLETKRIWQEWALATNAIIIFPHDPTRPAGRLTRNDKGYTLLEPVTVDMVQV